ncbi:hypothetical protein BDL97_14G071700 [Sphagnum fallax]|nr:hypothetical protein BDL97_14G071700 [Sphagnum fallax]
MLPSVYSSEKFRFSAGFIEVRALDAFLNRIATHPQLCMSEDLRNFLQADKEVWTMERARSVEVERSEYEKLKHYVLELEDHLAEVQQQSMKLVKRQQEVGQVLSGFGKSVKLLGNCEGGSLGKAFADLGDCSDELSSKLQSQGLDLLLIFEEPLKEYVCTVQAIEVVMADRAQAYREKLKLLRPDKAGKAEAEVTEIKDQSDEAKLRHEEIVRLMEQDMVQFQEAKTHDLGLVLNDFAHTQAQLTSDTANACQTLLIFVIPAWMKLK